MRTLLNNFIRSIDSPAGKLSWAVIPARHLFSYRSCPNQSFASITATHDQPQVNSLIMDLALQQAQYFKIRCRIAACYTSNQQNFVCNTHSSNCPEFHPVVRYNWLEDLRRAKRRVDNARYEVLRLCIQLLNVTLDGAQKHNSEMWPGGLLIPLAWVWYFTKFEKMSDIFKNEGKQG